MLIGTLVLTIGAYFYGRHEGSVACELAHAQAQVEVEKKVRKSNAKIDKATPFSADKRTAIEWLLKYTRQ